MPASSSELIAVSLQNSSERESKGCCGSFNVKSQDQELNVLSKQILIQDFDCENWWQSSSHSQSTVRRVCCPINKKENHQTVTNNNKFLKKDKSKMAYSKAEDKLEEPRVTLWSPDKVVLGWRKTFPPGAGMVNLGNSCYMNSSLQALFHIPSLANWLLEEINTHIPSCESNPQNYSFCSICTMMRTIKQSLDHGTTVFKPLLLHNKLKCICKTFGYGRQEDAHEFIKLLIDHMEKSFLQHKRAVKLDHRSKETTPLNQIFGGYLRQQVICPLCCYVSTTFSHFQDLVLDIRSVNSVDEALNLYFKKETLDSDNAYKCEKCHKKVPATKRHLIERAPHVLLLQLKRFTISGGKITKHVNIQKNIDISRYVNGVKPLHPNGTGSYFYRLVSMVIHIGSSQHGGHYTAVAEASNNTMFEFDDASVRPISVQSALLKNPYILFYEMVRKPKSNSVPKQVIRQSSEKALIRQSSNDKISKPLPTSLSTSCMWNGTNSHATAEDIGEAVVHNGISNSKKSPLLPQKEREKISFGIKSHGFSKGQDENKYSKPNGLILKRPFQLNSSSLTKSHTNGRNYVSSGLVPYNDESESSDDNESTDNRDTKDSCKFVNGHSNGHEKFVNKSGKSTDSSENSRSNNNNGDKGNDYLKSKNHVEKMSNVDKIKKDKIKEDTTCSTSQGISGLNNKSTSFLPRSVQIQSSGNGKNVGGNKVNNSMPKILNGHSSTDNLNEKKNSEHEKIDKVSLKEEHNDSYGTNSGNRTKKENGYICNSSSNGLSPVDVRTPNSSPSQSLTDRSKTKSKPEKVLKERDSFSGWISCNNTHKTELEKSFSHDSVLNSKVQQNDKSETASLKSKESLDSNRSDKSSKSVKKSIFSLFPCVSSTQSPDFSPEDEQINSVIENKSSPVRTDPKRLPENKSISQNYPQKPEVASYSKEKNISRLKEEEEDEETEDDNDDDDYDDEDDDDNFHVQKFNSSGKSSSNGQGNYSLTSNGSLDSPLVKENNISERLENGENYEEKSSKSKHQKSPQTPKVINAENHGCEENKKERNFSIKDEENFSMEEKKSRHKKKHKMKPNGAIKCDGSIPTCNGVSSNSSNNTDSNIIIYNWNRNVKDLSDDLPSNKKNETVFSNNFIKNASWNGSDDLSVVNALKRAGELPFGHEVKTWEGEESVFDKEIRKERNQAKKRSADDMYNDDYDRGKVRKKRFKSFHFDSTERRENPFQKFQNEYINNNHKINSNFSSKNSSDENTFHTNNFRSNSYNSTTTTSNGNSTSSINNHSKTNGSHIYGFNDRNYNGIGSNKNNSNSNINNGNLSRNISWDSRNSPFPSQQNHFRPGLYNYSRSKPHQWYKNYRNGKGKFGKKRDFRNSRH
ncbi:UNVERIFIED_CONTAM: hypothetical protein RMT77_016399 [Armadillidium vulgare]